MSVPTGPARPCFVGKAKAKYAVSWSESAASHGDAYYTCTISRLVWHYLTSIIRLLAFEYKFQDLSSLHGYQAVLQYCFSDNEFSGPDSVSNQQSHRQSSNSSSEFGNSGSDYPNQDNQQCKRNNEDDKQQSGSKDDKSESMLACNICFEVASVPVVTLCGHMYCRECIIEWISVRSQEKCPVCRAVVTQEKLIPFYGRGISSSSGPDPRRSNPSRSRPYRMAFSPPRQRSQNQNPSNDMHFSFYGNLFGQEIAFGDGNVQGQNLLNLVFFCIAVFVMLLMTSPFPYYYHN